MAVSDDRVAFGLWNRIIPSRIEWIAAQDAPDCQPTPLERPVFIDCLIPIMGARRIKPAGVGRQRSRECGLVQPDDRQDDQAREVAWPEREIPQPGFRLDW